MKERRVSVIIPTLNSAEYLEKSIRSILDQTYENIEVIVVDDGSDDSTVDIVEEISDGRNNIKLIERESSGIPSARNRGISEATGYYIANQDSDDISHEERLETQIEKIQERNLDAIGTGTHDIDDNGSILFRRNVIESINSSDVRQGCPIIHGTALIKREVLNELGGYDTNFPVAEDKDLWVRMDRKDYNLGNVDLPLYRFRRHGDSTYASNIRKTKTYGMFSILRADDRISEQELDTDDIDFDELKIKMSEDEVTNYYMDLAQELVRYGDRQSAREFAVKSLRSGRYSRSLGVLGLSFMPKSAVDTIIRNYRTRVHNKNIQDRNS